MRFRKLIVGAVLLGIPATLSAQVSADAKAGIAEGNRVYAEGWNAGDAAKVASVYATDAVLMPPGVETVKGRAAIETALEKELAAMAGARLALETVEIIGQGDMLIDVGSYEITAADGSHMDHGKYMAVWKKEGGSWKIVRDIYNSSMAP